MSEFNFEKINGTLLYVQVQESVKAYVKPGAESKPNEWKCSVAISEDYADALEEYAKELDTKLSLKKVKVQEFEDKYKCAVPDDIDGKNVYILTLRKSVELGKTGKPVPPKFQPKVFEQLGNKIVDITQSKLVANGSKGIVSIDKFDRSAGGSSLYLRNVLVTDLVEYVKNESDYESGSEFDDGGDTEVQPKAKAPSKTLAKPLAKPKKVVEDDDSEDSLPF